MTLAPGSMPWLMRHELRLYWRSGFMKGTSLAFLIIFEVLLHLVAAAVALAVRFGSASAGSDLPSILPALLVTAGLLVCFLLMLSRSLNGIVQVLYTRGDLDLLLSSPLAPKSIIGVRVFTVALTVTLEVGVLTWPFANMFLLFGMPAASKLYVLLPAIGMLDTGVGIVLALTLFRLLGPRTTRLVGQLLAALIGMTAFLLSQLPNMLRSGPAHRTDHFNAFGDLAHANLGHYDVLLVPARLIISGYLPTLLFALISAALLLLTLQSLSGQFMRAATAVGSVGGSRDRRASERPLRFRCSLRRVLITKELRLIRRDPLLLMQLLQQSIFLLPLCFALWRAPVGHLGRVPWFWLAIIFMCGTLATALAWITVAAEDAPELLRSAPPTRAIVVRAKIEAALLPIAPLWLIPILVIGRTQLWFAICLGVCAFGCSVSNALLQVYRPPGKRDSFKTRGRGSAGKTFIEIGLIMAWILVCALLTWIGTLVQR